MSGNLSTLKIQAETPRVLMAAYTNYRRDPRVKREAEALVAQGYDVTFLARRQPGEPHQENVAGVKVNKAPALPNKPDSFAAYMVDYLLFSLALALHLTIHPRRYRLIHINNMPDFLVLAAFLPKLLGTPIIHDVHDLMPELYMEKFRASEHHWAIRLLRAQERIAGRLADAVLTVEDRLKDILVARGISRDKITVLMNLPDEKIFAPRTPAPPKSAGAPFVLVYHGTLARRLGLDIALEAAARLKDRIGSLEVRIIGAGEERDRLIALRDRLGLEKSVHFSEGFVALEMIPGLLADADVGLVPLRRSNATDIMLPTKLLEYVQMGIPCIVPKTRTIQRYFDETMVHFFDAGDPDSLASAILDLYRRPEKRKSLQETAAAKFLARYRWADHQQIYTGLVGRLLSPSQTPAALD